MDRRLILISAPAGFGKTTLVSEWGAKCKRPIAWLTLDERDNDLVRFLTYLIAALRTLAPKMGEEVLEHLHSAQAPGETLLTALLNEIAEFPEKFALVLDDYHVLDSASIDQTLTFLLDHLPPNLSLVITTREDPSLPLARYRARGQLIEIRAADLRFTPQEAGQFLNQMMNLNLSEENVNALELRTEGWIAGLQLAALSMQGREDIGSFVQAFTGSHRFVLDYLVEEVLRHQSGRTRDFLLQTSILESFCAPLCDGITESDDGKEILDYLEHNNLFLIPLDDLRLWYRYHRLFGEVLQAHLMGSQPEEADRLHRRASSWYEDNGLRSDSIHHALLAKDFHFAADLIELAWPAAEEGSIQALTWLGWVKTLPEKIIHHRPVLNVCYAYALLGRGDLDDAHARFTETEAWLELAAVQRTKNETLTEKLIVIDDGQFNSLPATIAIGHAYIAQALGNIQDTVKFANRVLQLVPEEDSFRHKQASMMLGMTYWASGNLEAADRVFADYTLKLQKCGNILDAISTSVVLADIRLALGRLQDASLAVDKLLRYILDLGKPIAPEMADLYRQSGELQLEQGNLESAVDLLQKSKELGEKEDLPVWRYRWFIARAKENEIKGDLDGALNLLDEAQRLYIRTPLPDVQSIEAMKARIWIKQGNISKAMEWVGQKGLSTKDELSYLNEFEHITLAKILLAQYQIDSLDDSFQDTSKLLVHLLKVAEDRGRIKSVIEILVLQALLYQAKGDITLALAPLKQALTLAVKEGFIHIFLDAGKPGMELMSIIQTEDNDQKLNDFIFKLLSCFDKTKAVSEISGNLEMKKKPVNKARTLVEPLSERELDVLKLLRTELNGPEIARECMLSLTTIRTHTQNIYSKLGVNNRRAAVRRAEELDLF